MILSDLVVIVVCPLFMFNVNTRHVCDKKRLCYHNQTSLQHLMRNKLNLKYFTCD